MTQATNQRSVWITGASSGIGRALAETFAGAGDAVFATARSADQLGILADRIRQAGGACDVMNCDVRNEAAVTASCDRMKTLYGRIDILINNAGVTTFKEFSNTSVGEFDRIVETNLRGMFLTTSAVLPLMMSLRKGLIMNILSYATKVVYERSAAYAASKAGAEAMMNVLRAEVRGSGIRVVNIVPGAVLTPIWHPKHQEKFSAQMLLPEEVARTIHNISIQPESMMIEEVIIRPQGGDLRV
jgi:NADP-dependent 3-hydroxy acid dehydrogenase YdfG